MSFFKSKPKKKKEKGLFSKVLDVYWERAMAYRALRTLSRQEWSVEFLTQLLVRAAKAERQNLVLEIWGPNGARFVVKSADSVKMPETDIFDKLDDPMAVQEFILYNNRRR